MIKPVSDDAIQLFIRISRKPESEWNAADSKFFGKFVEEHFAGKSVEDIKQERPELSSAYKAYCNTLVEDELAEDIAPRKPKKKKQRKTLESSAEDETAERRPTSAHARAIHAVAGRRGKDADRAIGESLTPDTDKWKDRVDIARKVVLGGLTFTGAAGLGYLGYQANKLANEVGGRAQQRNRDIDDAADPRARAPRIRDDEDNKRFAEEELKRQEEAKAPAEEKGR